MISAAEAYRIGLVQDIAPAEELDARINEILGHLVQGGPAALAATKQLIRDVSRGEFNDDMRNLTANNIATVRASPEGREGIRSFLEKSRPAWVAPYEIGTASTTGGGKVARAPAPKRDDEKKSAPSKPPRPLRRRTVNRTSVTRRAGKSKTSRAR